MFENDHNPFRAEMAHHHHQEGPPESSLRPMTAHHVPNPAVIRYPPDLAAAAEAYHEAHRAWRTELANLMRAEAAVPSSAVADAEALTEAVRAGKATPKPTEPAARDALARQTVRTRDARERAAEATARWGRELESLGDAIVPVCVAALTDALTAYDDAVAAARELEAAAYQRVKLATAAAALAESAAKSHGVSRPEWNELNVTRPTINTDATQALRFAVDQWRQKFDGGATPKP